ncbi:polysaccharide biosynthesis/export family protein [Dysgonomonas sp. 520]|uniref:polysaccharide biosynthesis/export family protein n=1 Tax=Dysgonomonas sp. 520 TaxID=2302931 RepID=UPI0013D0FEF3|nr:polysaccharide biosynthesis/export family protein [Dysgonomonas sp. 520]NDW09004.1 hypothetical protein [Dysgonomonas sp. 520]
MKNNIPFLSVFVFSAILFFSSCNGYKELPYLANIDESTKQELLTTVEAHEPVIKPNDILSIIVNSTIVGSVSDFNLPMTPSGTSFAKQTTITTASPTSGSIQNYLVDKGGYINFPVLGELKIGGMTRKEAQDYITSLIYPKYIAEKPIVNIRFLNFKVSVLGEVLHPGTYESDNGQMTILDALAAAGDMTIYGRRDNVMLVRIKDDGGIDIKRINLQDKSSILNQDVFYLQQNDKLYVETNKAKGNNSRFGTFESVSLSAISIIISIVSVVAIIIRN